MIKKILFISIIIFVIFLVTTFFQEDIVKKNKMLNDSTLIDTSTTFDINSIPLSDRLKFKLNVLIDEKGYLNIKNETEANLYNIRIDLYDMTNTWNPIIAKKILVKHVPPFSDTLYKDLGYFPIITHRKPGGNYFYWERGQPRILDGYEIK